MEKSLVSFMANYPTWQPSAAAKQLLTSLAAHNPGSMHPGPHFPFTAHAEHFTMCKPLSSIHAPKDLAALASLIKSLEKVPFVLKGCLM